MDRWRNQREPINELVKSLGRIHRSSDRQANKNPRLRLTQQKLGRTSLRVLPHAWLNVLLAAQCRNACPTARRNPVQTSVKRGANQTALSSCSRL